MRPVTATVLAALCMAGLPFGAVGQSPSAADLDRKARIEATAAVPTQAQLDRKARSIARLQAEGVPTVAHLPVITSEADSLPRTTDAVAQRAIGLMIHAVLGETGDQELIANLLDQFDAHDFLTPAERALLDVDPLSQRQRTDAAWRYEGVEVLLWAVGLLDDLSPADTITDVPALAKLFREEGTEGVLARARLRPQSEILDAADYVYRLHWAVTEARLNGTPSPDNVDPSVVYERHYALNWLIGYAGLSWDNMATDT